jgi:predicted nuclease of predicted toxin-antitoxin system
VRFLVDECCPRAFVETLGQAGHDVVYVAETAASARDEDVAEFARREQRFIVTQDYDFGELAIRHGLAVPGVILVACPALSTLDRAKRLQHIVDEFADRLPGALAVIEPKRVRLRSIPSGSGTAAAAAG